MDQVHSLVVRRGWTDDRCPSLGQRRFASHRRQGGRQLHGPTGLTTRVVTDRMYSELVAAPADPVQATMVDRVDQSFTERTTLVLRQAKLIGDKAWRKNVSVSLSLAAQTTYQFPWAWVNGHTTVAYELARGR